jgi:predicted nucleic acid-binding protein
MNDVKRVFVDSNVLLYAIARDNKEKQMRAREWLAVLWDYGNGRLSWQVLLEFYVNAVRKTETPRAEVRQYVDELTAWGPVQPNLSLLHRAWHWTDSAHISWWDSLIVAAAEETGAQWLLTEDLQCGQRFDSVVVINPFTSHPDVLRQSR